MTYNVFGRTLSLSQSINQSGVPQSSGFGPELEVRVRISLLRECNFVAVYLTFVQFSLQLKCCLLEEFRTSVMSSLSTQSVCHTISLESESDIGLQSESSRYGSFR